MRSELQGRLVERWPLWFQLRGDVRHTLMRHGFDVGDGWFDLIWRLCEQLEPLVTTAELEPGTRFEVLQVKEKLGGLRFYVNYCNDAITALIEEAEIESFRTCDTCGKSGERRPSQGRIVTRCHEHRIGSAELN